MPNETPKTKQIACGDIVPGCGFTASATTDDELLKQVAAHAAETHGLAQITPELAAKVRDAIKSR